MKRWFLMMIGVILMMGLVSAVTVEPTRDVDDGQFPVAAPPIVVENISLAMVNSSEFWDNLNTPADIFLDNLGNVFVPSPSTNQVLSFNGTSWTAETLVFTVDTQKNALGFLFNDTSTIFLNESLLNETIDARVVIGDTNTQRNASGFLFNDTDSIFFNESLLNETIDARATVDTNTQKNASGFLFNDTDSIFFNDSLLNLTIDARDTDTNTQKNASGFVFNDTDSIFFNDSLLNETIDARIVIGTLEELWNLSVDNSTIHPFDLNLNVSIGTNNANASLEVSGNQDDFPVQVCVLGIACYRFEIEEAGDLAVDNSKFFNFGSIIGGERVASKGTNDTGNFSLELDTGDYVHADSEPQIELNGNISLGGWIFQDISQEQYIISKVNNQTSNYGLLMTSNRRVVFTVERNGVLIAERTSAQIPLGEWAHVVGTLNGTTILIYINGVVEATSSSSTATVGVSDDLFIGIRSDITDGFDGRLDEIAIANFTADPVQILNLFNNGLNLTQANISALDRSPFRVTGVGESGGYFTIDRFGRVGIGNPNPSFRLDVNGSARFIRDATFKRDIFVEGTIVGSSPIMLSGGLNVTSGNATIENGNLDVKGSIIASFFNWITGSIYLAFDGFTLTFNETQLNKTIDHRAVTGAADTQKNASGFLFNNTDTIFFNESLLNLTIDARATGGGTVNITYGNLFKNSAGEAVGLVVVDTYKNITNLTSTLLNGFILNPDNTSLMAQTSGAYQASYKISFTGSANNDYVAAIGINSVPDSSTVDRITISTGGDTTALSAVGILAIQVGDNITIERPNYHSSKFKD